MNAPKHATTNYKALRPFLDALADTEYLRIENEPYERLCIESLGYADYKGRPVYSMAHYYEQNGDLMADPDLTFSVDIEAGAIWPQTYQQDDLGLYQEVFKYTPDGRHLYSRSLLCSLDDFLWHWTKNLKAQGFYTALAAMQKAV